jgi:hypothetical protein
MRVPRRHNQVERDTGHPAGGSRGGGAAVPSEAPTEWRIEAMETMREVLDRR